jgi:hypothetical protein
MEPRNTSARNGGRAFENNSTYTARILIRNESHQTRPTVRNKVLTNKSKGYDARMRKKEAIYDTRIVPSLVRVHYGMAMQEATFVNDMSIDFEIDSA